MILFDLLILSFALYYIVYYFKVEANNNCYVLQD